MFQWLGSVRSIVTMLVAITFCWLACSGRIEPKDFMLIVSLVFNFYFMNKVREGKKETTPPSIPPAAPLVAIFLVLGMLMPTTSRAQSATPVDILKKIPSIKTGIGYSIVDSRINYLSTLTVAQYKNFNLEIGYAGDSENSGDKIIVAATYKLIALRDYLSVPVLDLVECNIGAYYGVGNLGAGNEQDYGATATAITVKF